MTEIDKKTNNEILNDFKNSELKKDGYIYFYDRENKNIIATFTYRKGALYLALFYIPENEFIENIDTFIKKYDIAYK